MCNQQFPIQIQISLGKVQIFDFSRTPNTNIRTNILILKTANTNMTFFGYLGSKIPQSFGTQIYLYPIMQVLANYIQIEPILSNKVLRVQMDISYDIMQKRINIKSRNQTLICHPYNASHYCSIQMDIYHQFINAIPYGIAKINSIQTKKWKILWKKGLYKLCITIRFVNV